MWPIRAFDPGTCCSAFAPAAKGIPPDKLEEMASAGTPGVGIRGMRERLRQLGGTLKIESGQSGTIVAVGLPIPEGSTSPVVSLAGPAAA